MNADGVKRVEVAEEGLVGSLWSEGPDPRPGVIALGGSEGGAPVQLAALLAEAGFAAMALAYFGRAGLPPNLVEVPLDYVERAIGWLRRRPEVADGPVGLVGASKGAELALLCATSFPDQVAAVVAYAPSSVAFAGISWRREGRRRSSWSRGGEPLAFVPYPPRARPAVRPRGLALRPMYRAALVAGDAVTRAAIPIERSSAPVLLLSGDRDSLWPSSDMAAMLVQRAERFGTADRVTHLRYADAGHSFVPWAPDIGSVRLQRFLNGARLAGIGGALALGGRPRANREALADGWRHATAFLVTHLKPCPSI